MELIAARHLEGCKLSLKKQMNRAWKEVGKIQNLVSHLSSQPQKSPVRDIDLHNCGCRSSPPETGSHECEIFDTGSFMLSSAVAGARQGSGPSMTLWVQGNISFLLDFLH